MPNDFDVLLIEQMLYVASSAGKEIIDANNDRAIGEQALAKV